MKPDDEFPIEPLPEAAWKRIEQALFAELDSAQAAPPAPPRRRLGRGARIALWTAPLAAAAAALLIWQALQQPAARAPLESQRRVTAAQPMTAQIDDATVRIEPASALVLVETERGGALVVIERGAARFAVPKRQGRPPFVVQAGDVQVEVVGTRFRVERVGGSAAVEAYEGSVRVRSGGAQRLLQRGDRWPAPALPTVPATAAPRAAEVPAAGSESAPAIAGDGRQRFEQAARLEAKQPQQALRIYRSLARQSGPWAENALFAAGRLELERGQRASARRLLSHYLDRHPDGANAADARSLLGQLNRTNERTSP